MFGVFFVQRIVTEKHRADVERDLANARRVTLLEERGRSELLAHNAGNALAYLVGAAHDGKVGGARGFLIAEAMEPFEAQVAHISVGKGDVVVAASPDGRWIATAGDGPIELRTPDGHAVRSFGAYGITRVVSFDRTSTRLVAGGDDGIARIWTLPDGEAIELPGHRGAILDAEFSPDGRTLVTTGADASVRLWELPKRRVTVIGCHAKPVVSARFSLTGEEVLTASADATACLIEHHGPIERSNGEEWDIERQIKGHTAAVNSAEWSADGRFIVTASDDETARVWSHSRGKPVYASGLRHDLGTVVQRALMTDDGLIVTAGSDHMVRLWELPASIPDDGTSPPPVRPPHKLPGHTGRIVVAALSADSRQLVTGGLDGLAKVWALPSGLELATFEHADAVTSVAFVPGTSLLVTGSRDGTARIWNTRVTDPPIELGNAATAIAIAPDGAVAASLADSLVRIARPGQPDLLDLDGHLAIPLAVAFTPDGSRLVSAGQDAVAIVWDPHTGAQVAKLAATTQDPPPPIQALAVAPDGDHVALVRDGNVEVWSLATRARVLLLAPPRGRVDALAIDPVTGAIAAVGQDGTFVVWDAHGAVQQATSDRGSPYRTVAFSPAGDALVTAGAGFADMRPVIGGLVGKIDVTLEGGMGVVRAVLVTPDGSRIITGGDNGLAMIWDRYKGKLLGTRDHRDKPITALAVRGDTLWVGSEDPLLTSWPIRVETGSADSLEKFLIEKHVPVELHADVLRKRTP
jgi:WD40 repeat protein